MNGKMKAIELAKTEFEQYLTADTALPQTWLNQFVKDNEIDYELVRSTTIWVYLKKPSLGIPYSCNSIVQDLIETEYFESWFF